MTQIKALVIVPMDSNLPADAITNTWYFDGDGPAETVAALAQGQLEEFYQTAGAAYFGNDVGTTLETRFYAMADAKPRVPVLEDTIVHGGATGNHSYPHEVAICLSYHAEFESGVPNARRRGRVFLGPIKNSLRDDQEGNVYIPSAIRDTITAAAAALADASNSGCAWSQYSPTTDATESLDTATQDVVGGWVDNAFDTIRSRGPKPNARTEFVKA